MRNFLVLLLLCAPSVVAAQVGEPELDWETVAIPPPPPPEPMPQRSYTPFGPIFGITWAGLGIGTAIGAAIGAAIADAECGACAIELLIGMYAGAASLAPLTAGIAAWAMGDALHRRGSAWWSVVGAYVSAGLGAGIGALAGLGEDEGTGLVVGMLAGYSFASLGATLGYVVSDEPTPIPIAPTVSVGPRFLVLGVAAAL